MVADGTALLRFDNVFLNFWPFLDFPTKVSELSTRWRSYKITCLFALRFYLDDKTFYKRKPFYQHWADIAELLLKFLFSSCSRTKTTTSLMSMCNVKLNLAIFIQNNWVTPTTPNTPGWAVIFHEVKTLSNDSYALCQDQSPTDQEYSPSLLHPK